MKNSRDHKNNNRSSQNPNSGTNDRVRCLMSENEANKYCFDCGQRGVTFVNCSIGAFLCMGCSGIVRGLRLADTSTPMRIKSLAMSTLTEQDYEMLRLNGNKKLNLAWDRSGLKPPPGKKSSNLESLLRTKYENNQWWKNADKIDTVPSINKNSNIGSKGTVWNDLNSTANEKPTNNEFNANFDSHFANFSNATESTSGAQFSIAPVVSQFSASSGSTSRINNNLLVSQFSTGIPVDTVFTTAGNMPLSSQFSTPMAQPLTNFSTGFNSIKPTTPQFSIAVSQNNNNSQFAVDFDSIFGNSTDTPNFRQNVGNAQNPFKVEVEQVSKEVQQNSPEIQRFGLNFALKTQEPGVKKKSDDFDKYSVFRELSQELGGKSNEKTASANTNPFTSDLSQNSGNNNNSGGFAFNPFKMV